MRMAAMVGLEPTIPESKSDVLPLHHIAMLRDLYQASLNALDMFCSLGVLQLNADSDGATSDNASFLERLGQSVLSQRHTVDHDGCVGVVDALFLQDGSNGGVFIGTDLSTGVRTCNGDIVKHVIFSPLLFRFCWT